MASLPGFLVAFTVTTVIVGVCAGLPGYVLLLIVGAGWFFLFRRARKSQHDARSRVVPRFLLADGLCPTCAYPLGPPEGDQPEPLTCTECGARWDEQHVRRRHTFSTDPETDAARIRRWLRPILSPNHALPTTADDANSRTYPLVHPTLRAEIAAAGPDRRELLISVVSTLSRRSRPRRAFFGIAVFAVLCLCLVVLVRSGDSFALLVVLVLASQLPSYVHFTGMGVKSHKLCAAMVGQGLCPCCAETLHPAIETDQEWRRICPVCDAHWRVHPPSTP